MSGQLSLVADALVSASLPKPINADHVGRHSLERVSCSINAASAVDPVRPFASFY